ncbi:dTDP-4-amino-4,6-dideoxygalactose transaminase [Microlunatus soli]|uniref:dTDP-4-amino-4,6-dideoxygalactose transaminase n=2 Tax=Microlunatus soli TaxID=630515 RepID=A0A1H1SN56_9ACTN|nr:dTDP-4-amino-4,6-dideoxygalactose transaminase [Microlunatus soli]
MNVPFLDLPAQQAEIADEVLPRWRQLFETAAFIGGPEVASFEDEYADYIGVGHCVGVGNGTDAIEIALRAAGIVPGDEVILPANTFIATAEAVSRVGAVPVLVDVDDEHLLIDPAAVDAAITRRTRAIVPVHLFGQTAPVEGLYPIAQRHDLVIIEDAAQSQGATSPFGRAGALGTIAATSFYPGKNLGAAGDGGAVLTDDGGLADFARSVSAHGSRTRYVHDRIGFNSRLDAIQAVELRAKLRRLDKWNDLRREAAHRYAELLADISGVRLPTVRAGNSDVWHLYVIRVEQRDRVLAELSADGIGAAIHYPTPVHLTAAYADLGYKTGAFPVAESAATHILSLPMFPHLAEDQQLRVADALRHAVNGDQQDRPAAVVHDRPNTMSHHSSQVPALSKVAVP